MKAAKITVKLQFENKSVECYRNRLINESNYFKNVIEYTESIGKGSDPIQCEDEDYYVMNFIVNLMNRDVKRQDIYNDNIFLILKTCFTYNFFKLQKRIIGLIEIEIKQNKSVFFWMGLRKIQINWENHDLKKVYLKSKFMAMLNFNHTSDYLLQKEDFNTIRYYFGNMNIHCPNEFEVFRKVILWTKQVPINLEQILILLKCVDFQRINCYNMRRFAINVLRSNSTLFNVIECIIAIRHENSLENFNEGVIKECKLLLQTNQRFIREVPCFALHNKKSPNSFIIAYYDIIDSTFKKLFNFNYHNKRKFVDYRMFNYKHYLYIYCNSEKDISNYRNEPNNPMLQIRGKIIEYNLITDRITYQKEICVVLSVPWCRRIVSCIVVKNILYIITTLFDINKKKTQTIICWLNLSADENKFHVHGPLYYITKKEPKVCSFNCYPFLLNVIDKMGCIFTHLSRCEYMLSIFEDCSDPLPIDVKTITIFPYNNNLFIKNLNVLIELQYYENQFTIVNKTVLSGVKPYDEVQSTLCGNILFSFYKKYKWFGNHGQHVLSFGTFNLETLESNYVFENEPIDKIFKINREQLHLKNDFQIHPFNMFHYSLIERDAYVNVNYPVT